MDSQNLIAFILYQITLGDCLQSIGTVYTGMSELFLQNTLTAPFMNFCMFYIEPLSACKIRSVSLCYIS